MIPEPFEPLARYNQWVIWELRGDKKLPVHPDTMEPINPHDPKFHMSYSTAASYGRNVGFVFTDKDPFFFLDVDNCYSDGAWNQVAIDICTEFSGCAVEISQSREGLHVIGKNTDIKHGCVNDDIHSQFYTEKRFVALTFYNPVGSADYTPDGYEGFVRHYFPENKTIISSEWTEASSPEYTGPNDDDELIKKMLKSKSSANSFGAKASLKDLWEKNEDELSKFYPDPRRSFDWSQADAALCTHLAFWAGKNCERMDRLFRMSGLYRDKWDQRPDYVSSTILKAVSLCSNVYSVPKVVPADESVFLYPDDQVEYFNGCHYIRSKHEVFLPDGDLVKPEVFRVIYSGKGKIFHLDTRNDKTTRNAWKAFTESEVNHTPVAHSTCFRPELSPRTVINEEGRDLINTYVPVEIKCVKGDIKPFITHVRKLLPIKRDQDILLSYLAATVRHPGVKFQWCVVLQGTFGNGKSFFGSCVERAVGSKYVHWPNARDISNKFNEWLESKLFIVVEEIRVSGRDDIIDSMKTMITNTRIDIQGKGKRQITCDNRANFLLLTNYDDGVEKTRDDRRYSVFFTAQQNIDDVKKSGMDGDYGPNLYKWARNGGYEHVAHFLKYEYEIKEEFNPAGSCQWAPDTSTTHMAIQASVKPEAQDIEEAIQEGRPGFTGGWISSIMLSKLLERKNLSNSKRASFVRDMGYIPHPHLHKGRLTSYLIEEGGKPRLYIRYGHVAMNITDGVKIRDAYCNAQGYVNYEMKKEA